MRKCIPRKQSWEYYIREVFARYEELRVYSADLVELNDIVQ